MSKPRRPNALQHLPGNDGAWFLKAVGVEQTATDLDDVGGNGDNTSKTVQGLWDAEQADDDAFNDWSPQELDRTAAKGRNFRWSLLIGGLVLLGALVAVAVWLPGTSERRALARATEYGTALADLAADLPSIQQTLATLTEPDADVSQFPDLLPTITEAADGAEQALQLAGEPLPRPWPLASAAPFEDLAPHRDALSVDATAAQAITRRLGDLLAYRMVMQDFLDIDELPTTATGIDLNTLTADLASATADSSNLLAELPEDAALAEHKRTVEDTLARFGDLQVEHVEALRSDDTDTAEALNDEYLLLRQDLAQLMLEALARMRGEIDDALIDLHGSIEETMEALPE